MTDDSGPMVVAGIIALLVVFALGVGVGRWTGRGTPPSAEAADTVKPSSVPLRCTNGGDVREWTLEEREARYHAAKMWHRTAEDAGVWNGRGARAFRLAALGYLEVIACSGEAP